MLVCHALLCPAGRFCLAENTGEWIITRRWPWTHDEMHVDPQRLPDPVVEGTGDGEGGMQYRCLLRTPEHGAVAFSEHVKQDRAALARDRMALLIRNAAAKIPRPS